MEIGIIIRQWGKIIGNRNNNVAMANGFVSDGFGFPLDSVNVYTAREGKQPSQ